jgi:hypothetical protein
MLYIFDSEAFSTKICLQDLNFNSFQGFCAVGADDLTAEPGIDQVRDPVDVIDVGMGEKQKVNVGRRQEPVTQVSAPRWVMVMLFGIISRLMGIGF